MSRVVIGFIWFYVYSDHMPS